MKRGIIAIIAGLFFGVLTYYLMELLGGGMYIESSSMPLTKGADSAGEFYHEIYSGFWIWVMFGHMATAFIGGIIASLIDRSHKQTTSIITGALLLGFGVFQLSAHFHPTWVWAVSVVQFVPMAILGSTLIRSSLEEIRYY